MLKEAQKTTWAEKIKDCETDAKKLYTLINNLTNNNKDNPLPESQSDEGLANQFAQYFISKIKTVDHDVLLDVLNNRFGLEGNTQNWIVI